MTVNVIHCAFFPFFSPTLSSPSLVNAVYQSSLHLCHKTPSIVSTLSITKTITIVSWYITYDLHSVRPLAAHISDFSSFDRSSQKTLSFKLFTDAPSSCHPFIMTDAIPDSQDQTKQSDVHVETPSSQVRDEADTFEKVSLHDQNAMSILFYTF